VEGGLFTVLSGRWDIYSGDWKVGYIQRGLEGGIYTAVSGRLDIYSGEWKVVYIVYSGE
jgi:hypothetical protein